jgi:D-alanyl-D-alanine carboxypeptidase/D-alanyl-D-alanine-endopeptidase (penicillin-binding protein 4)
MQIKCRKIFFYSLVLGGIHILSSGAQTPAPPAVVHPAYPGGTSTPLGKAIVTILAEPAAARAHWGIAVTTLDGTPIYGLDEGKLFRPASNAKLYTTAAAMALLGPQSTVTTEVQSSEPSADGVIRGDVRLKSDGDANLSGMPFPYVPVAGETPASATPLKAIDDLAAQVAARGIKRITGGVVGDDTGWVWEPYPQSWAIDDMVWGYGAPVSSLSVNDSYITVTVKAGAHEGDAVVLTQSPDVGFYTLVAQVKTGAAKSATKISVERAVGSRTVTISGEIAPGGKDVEQLAVIDPPLFAAQALRGELIAHGVAVSGEARAAERPSAITDGFAKQSHEAVQLPPKFGHGEQGGGCIDSCLQVIASRTSPMLTQDVTYTLKESQNLHAEQMLRRLGKAWGSEASGAQGVRVVRQFLVNAGLDGGDFVFYDGSGLSDHDLVAPRGTAQLLAYATTQPWFAAWKAAFPIGGVDGTLAGRFKDAPLKGHVYGKTGTLGESRGLSGYLDCASGKQVIFSIYVDNHTPGGSADRAAMDKIVAAIASGN